jgi:hypothetical protein
MISTSHAARRGNHPLGWLALAVTLTGCSSVLGSDQAAFADEARVIITGESGVPLQLLTTTDFVASRDPETGELVPTILTTDTTILATLPHDQVYTVTGWDRFLAKLVNPDTAVTATIQMRVLMDGREVFNQRATMRDASLAFFVYFQP